MADSWILAEVLHLIEKYRERDLFIMGPKKQLRNYAWKDIANRLEKTVDACTKKMMTLMAALGREKCKI